MYEEFFGLKRRPFSATPDANCFLPLEAHQGALDALAVSCERGQGIGVLTGEAGLGKSLVGLRLAFELQPTFATVFLGHSAYATRRALLQAILFELKRPYDRLGEQELRLELTSALKAIRAEQQGFVLIVDEAHRLSLPLLDEVRLLTLLAEAGEPLARVVLIGNRDLEERLADPELAAFNQRVGCQVDLTPLTQAESLDYLQSSLEFAGGRAEDVFTDEALAFLAKAADGVPRCLNHLADHSLLLAFVTERRPVSADLIREALDDLKQLPLQWNDPISGGEIYRGMSQRPPMEDSAVDLWPQHEAKTEDEPRQSDSWNDSAFGDSAAAIEIGGELDDAATESAVTEVSELTVESEVIASPASEQFTCLKEDWQEIARQSSTEDELLGDVTELVRTLDSDAESRPLGETFAARDLEFGAPSPQSFVVEEFVQDHEPDDESESDPWSSSMDDDAQPVWNLPQQSWSNRDGAEVEFEEEPVLDRYVRCEAGTSDERIHWNHLAEQARAAVSHTTRAIKTAKLVMGTAGVADDQCDLLSPERQTVSELDSGIVESYSRKSRTSEQDDPQPYDDAKHEQYLPTELLEATFADDGLEEQIGAEVLDMYLDVRHSLDNRQFHSDQSTTSLEIPITKRFSEETAIEEPQPETGVDESLVRTSDPHSTRPDTIQRAYGRLFSELRRRRK